MVEWQLQVESVEQVKEPAVLDPMMGVHQRLLYAQSGDIVSVLPTNLEIQSVVLALIIMEGEEPLLELVLKQEVLKQKLMEEHLEEEKQ